MMTFEETSKSIQTKTHILDPSKAKAARKKRVEIHKPRTSSKQELHEDDDVTCESHAVVSVIGRRREMEDSFYVQLGLIQSGYDFFGVYDGHGGRHVADACRDRLHLILVDELNNNKTDGWDNIMIRCFDRMDKEVMSSGGYEEMEEMTVGSTVVVVVVGKDEVVVANCGDSRAVICRRGVAFPLSFDHKPDRPDELARIEAAGGRVIHWNGFRVLGVLATSRSIGDHYLKPYVSATPEITINKRTKDDEFIILASDGLWDVISNEVACQIVRRCLSGKIHRKSPYYTDGLDRNGRTEVAAALLVELAIAKGSKDNISVIVIELGKTR